MNISWESREDRKLLFSVREKYCEWSYYSGTGPGGQAKNKIRSAVRVHHPPSGARGQAQDTRSLEKNKQLAFQRMANTPEMQKWLRLEIARITGKLHQIEETVDRQMQASNLKVEVLQNGVWVPWTEAIVEKTNDSQDL